MFEQILYLVKPPKADVLDKLLVDEFFKQTIEETPPDL